MTDEILETKYFTIISDPDYIKAECPYCGWENKQDADDFTFSDLFCDEEYMTCTECGKDFRLVGADYD